MSNIKKIAIPRDLLSHTIDKLETLYDEGPPGEEWKSDELKKIIEDLTRLLGIPGENER